MIYKEISFSEFEENYINRPDGYLSIWFSFEDPREESGNKEFKLPDDVKSKRAVLEMDMVFPSRLQDRKIQFISVEISTSVEYLKATVYLRKTQALFMQSLNKNFESSDETIAEIDLE
jgi:hypothetical protein